MHHKWHNRQMTKQHADSDIAENEAPSKSQLKREAEAVQDLGKNLLNLSVDQQNSLELPESLKLALDEARRIKKNSALKRQLQYIGKLMRSIDIEPIQTQYDKIVNHFATDIKALHRLEKWRDRLLAEGDKALEELLSEVPHADRQHLRQLIRQSAKETQLKKPPKSAREIFKYLKTLFE